ncbi:MAG: transporter substrate-binding domain-containing protein [Trueperaceae bacterium]|nr:transporter substrate-binding domain-containing protein [Trueperaceae bacterium]
MKATKRRLGDFFVLLGLVAVLVLASYLPPDTSRTDLQRLGVIWACVPTDYPPLVTSDADAPGIDIELLRAVADELGLRLALNRISSMGRDFNPRNWGVTRARCQLLAGGVVDSPSTRTFLATSSPYLSTGWAMLVPEGFDSLQGKTVGFYSGTTGLDRIALSRYLRQEGALPITVGSTSELVSRIETGEFGAVVSEALMVRQLAAEIGWNAHWLPETLGRYPLALGLWKGDLTLKRSVENAIERIERSGRLAAILAKYDLVPISEAVSER